MAETCDGLTSLCPRNEFLTKSCDGTSAAVARRSSLTRAHRRRHVHDRRPVRRRLLRWQVPRRRAALAASFHRARADAGSHATALRPAIRTSASALVDGVLRATAHRKTRSDHNSCTADVCEYVDDRRRRCACVQRLRDSSTKKLCVYTPKNVGAACNSSASVDDWSACHFALAKRERTNKQNPQQRQRGRGQRLLRRRTTSLTARGAGRNVHSYGLHGGDGNVQRVAVRVRARSASSSSSVMPLSQAGTAVLRSRAVLQGRVCVPHGASRGVLSRSRRQFKSRCRQGFMGKYCEIIIGETTGSLLSAISLELA